MEPRLCANQSGGRPPQNPWCTHSAQNNVGVPINIKTNTVWQSIPITLCSFRNLTEFVTCVKGLWHFKHVISLLYKSVVCRQSLSQNVFYPAPCTYHSMPHIFSFLFTLCSLFDELIAQHKSPLFNYLCHTYNECCCWADSNTGFPWTVTMGDHI